MNPTRRPMTNQTRALLAVTALLAVAGSPSPNNSTLPTARKRRGRFLTRLWPRENRAPVVSAAVDAEDGLFGKAKKGKMTEPKYATALAGSHPDYPYENIVFQGGGARGIIYAGAVLALDEIGVLPYIKRVAAASAGCAPALFLALGLDGAQVKAETDALDMTTFFDGDKNTPWGLRRLALFLNLLRRLGQHPADKALTYFGQLLEKYTGNADLTFLELYQLTGRELCIVVSNLSRHQSEYCHVNTTPNMPIRRAIRASMSLPFLWQPIELFPGEKYVDGALFNNFPLKAFDGWFLSTRQGDSIFSKTLKKNPQLMEGHPEPYDFIMAYKQVMFASFEETNNATIGFMLSDNSSPDEASYATYLENLEARIRRKTPQLDADGNEQGNGAREPEKVPFPNTKLANKYLKKRDKMKEKLSKGGKYEEAYVELTIWMIRHAKSLENSVVGCPHFINSQLMIQTLEASPPQNNVQPELFGHDSWKEVVEEELDIGNNGYVSRSDIYQFWGRFNVRHAFMKNRKPKDLDSISSIGIELLIGMSDVAEEGLLRDPSNAKRICSLNTEYIGMLDLELEQGDKDFVYALGKRDTITWFQQKAGVE